MYKAFISTMALGAFLALGFTACNDEQLSRNNAHDPDAENYVLPVVDTILDTTAHYDSAKSIQVLTADNAVLLDRAANTEAPLALSVGNTGFMYAAVLPEMAEQGVDFVSSDPTVALVTAVPENPVQARIDGLKAGTAQVYVKSVDGQVRDSVTVDVKTVTTVVQPTKVTIRKNGINTKDTIKVLPDYGFIVTAYVYPVDANQLVTWTSNNDLIATVTKDGVIKPLRFGEARIVAITGNGVKDTLVVQVLKEVHGSIWDSRSSTIPQVKAPVGFVGGAWFTWATDLFSNELGTGNAYMAPAPNSEAAMADYVMLNKYVGVELSMGYSYTTWQGGGLGFNFYESGLQEGGNMGKGFCVSYASNKPVRMRLQWLESSNPVLYEVTLPATTAFKTVNIDYESFAQPSWELATEYQRPLVASEITGVLFSYLAINAKIDNAVLRVRSVGLPGECVFLD